MKICSKLNNTGLEELLSKCRLLREKLTESVAELSDFALEECCNELLEEKLLREDIITLEKEEFGDDEGT